MTLPCSQLDEFFDGELAAEAAAAFRIHLATCDRCQRQLDGRMQEAMVVGEAAPVADGVVPIARARARKSGNTRVIAIVGAAIAIAAAVVLVWSWRGGKPHSPQIADLGLTVSIEKGGTTMRGGAAHVGDRVHAKAADKLWIYRGDRELVLACPGASECRDGRADFDLVRVGEYKFVAVAATTIVPTGNLDMDLAAIAAANVQYEIATLDVQ